MHPKALGALPVRRGGGARRAGLPLLLAAVAILTVALQACAQNETTTATVYIPNVSLTYRPVWLVVPVVENGTVYVRVSCLSLGSCPPLTIAASNGTSSVDTSVSIGSCQRPPCAVLVPLNLTGRVTVTVSYNSVSKTFIVQTPVTSGAARDILTLAFIMGVVALAFRSDKRYAAVGLIVGAFIVAAASALGFISSKGYIVALLAVLTGVLLLWM